MPGNAIRSIFDGLHGAPFGMRIAITLSFSTLLILLLKVTPWLNTATQGFYADLGFPQAEAIFLTRFTIVYWLVGLGSWAVVWLVIRIEQPADPRKSTFAATCSPN